MAAEVRLNVGLNDTKAKEGLKAIADAIKPLTTPVKVDVDTKAALAGLKDLNAIASNLEKKLANVKVGNKVLGTGHNAIDEAIRHAETASRNFAAALREQMEAEQAAAEAHRGMVSSMNGVDQMIQQNEAASRAFAAALKQQMLAEQEEEKEARKAAQANKDLGRSSQEAASSAKTSGQAASEAAGGWSTFSAAVATALGNLSARVVHLAIMKIRQALRDALEEMKNVDTELTNISKVSGKTGTELEAIGDAAYDTASKYGVAASEYLSSVYDMQKAGMGDQAQDMGELAIKTMLVGDTTQEVASKFLIASNAAWKLNGDMERLGQIVDEADYINNNYATTLDKLAAGMPIVASVAENAGMSAEETIAALGTITAATQESGTKAATALRALILNISGEVGKYITEEGEEIEVTKESVSGMQKLLEKYAGAELEAAKAAGELIDPMTAIRALFKGMANDDLNDAQMFQLLSGMGGKLRTNQLTALVKNYETLYTDMMSHMKEAAGTADSEIDLMMNSWEKKTQKLKNTWTELIADIVDTNAIKYAIDSLTGIVDAIDSWVNKKKNPFYDSETTNKEIDDTKKKIDGLKDAIKELLKSSNPDISRIRDLEIELQLQEKILEAKKKAYKLEREEDAKKSQSKLTERNTLTNMSRDAEIYASTQGMLDNVRFTGLQDFQSDMKHIVEYGQEYYDSVIKVRDVLGDSVLTDYQKRFIETYEQIKDLSEAQNLSLGGTRDGYREIVDSSGKVVANVKEITEHEAGYSDEYVNKIVEAWKAWREAEDEAGEADTAREQEEAIDRMTQAKKAYDAANKDATDAERIAAKKIIDELSQADDGLKKAGDSADSVADAAAGIAPGVETAIPAIRKMTAGFQKAAEAAGSIKVNPGNIGIDVEAEGTKSAPGGPTLVNELGPELISENGHAYIANGGRPGIVNLSRGAIVLTATETRQALRGDKRIGTIRAAAGETPLIVGGGSGPTAKPKPNDLEETLKKLRKRSSAVAAAAVLAAASTGPGFDLTSKIEKNPAKKILFTDGGDEIKKVINAVKGGKGGGAGVAAGPSPAEILAQQANDTKDILSNIEKQAKLADNRGQYTKEENLWAKGQAEIDKMIAAYRKAGYKDTSDEILDLLNKRYEYEKKKDAASKKTIENAAKELKDKLGVLDKQASLADKEGDPLAVVKYYEKAQEEIKKMIDMYRKAGYKDDSKEILELLEKNVDYGEKQVKVYKEQWNNLIDALEADTEAQDLANKLAEKEQALQEAQQALDNARKQRTIRTYNAATGQWEWVADQSKIKSAQESLTKAEESYSEEVKDQAIKELEKLRDTMADLNNVILGPALSAILLKSESSEEFQNFARALNAVYGVGSYLSSTEGSSKVISTANDSHDTIYTFGNVTLTEEQASSMSVAELAQKLQVLKIS